MTVLFGTLGTCLVVLPTSLRLSEYKQVIRIGLRLDAVFFSIIYTLKKLFLIADFELLQQHIYRGEI